MKSLESAIYFFLKNRLKGISKRYVKNCIAQHPDYPNLTSATDVLDSLSIQYKAIVANKENLDELQFPILARSKSNGGNMVFIKNKEGLTTNLLEQWDGITLMLTSNNFTNNKANKGSYNKEQKQKKQNTLLAIFSIFLLGFPFFYNISNVIIAPLLLSVLSLLGLGIAALIYQQEQGIDNSITDTLCKKTEDCTAVTNSKAAILFWGIKWSDVGLVFFATLVWLLSAAAYSNQLNNIMPILLMIGCASLPFCLFSLYYQKFIAKKWCILCLYTLATLALQYIVLVWANNGFAVVQNFNWQWFMFIVMSFVFIASVWLILIASTEVKLII
jgi:uncharacterized membrane protein